VAPLAYWAMPSVGYDVLTAHSAEVGFELFKGPSLGGWSAVGN
jgi:hypothetical protein